MGNKLFTLPNILTLCNLACGCVAVVFALPWFDAAVFFGLTAAAAAFDFLDGMAARLTGQYSEIGKQLDSLADMVSFGVAPSAMLFSIYRMSSPLSGNIVPPAVSDTLGLAVFVGALFSALRLAKFNVDETQKDEFSGLPTPAAAIAIAALGWMWHKGVFTAPREAILILAAVVSWLLVCPLRMFSLKFKSFGWRGNELRYTFLGLCIVLIAVMGVGGVAACVGLYVCVSACHALYLRLK